MPLPEHERTISMDLSQTISLLHRKMNMDLNVRLKEIGLSYAQARLVRCLHSNGQMTQADLCKALGLDKSTVAKALRRMETSGFITKQINPDDTRSCLVSLTSGTLALLPQMEKIFSDWTDAVTSGMEGADKDIFFKLIHQAARQAAMLCKKE
jgi:DNA-binding MarR family transcriptional regulator